VRAAGIRYSASAKFCPECAHPVDAAPRRLGQPRFAAPDTYTPMHLAEKILTSKAALEGERKQVTILFVTRQALQPEDFVPAVPLTLTRG